MADYSITLYFKGGATANIKQKADGDADAEKDLKRGLAEPECVLQDRNERLTLTVRNPGENVIAYSVDRVGP